MNSRFQVGDVVTWTSRGRTKKGKIIEVVAANQKPPLFVPRNYSVKHLIGVRDHPSYIVLEDNGVYYRPHVEQLKLL
jgi:hypothetical protein